MYSTHIERFEKWCTENLIPSVEQEHVNKYLVYILEANKYSDNSLRSCIAALKYKLNKCEKNGFDFKRSRGKAKIVRPHTAFTEDKMKELFELASTNLEVNTLVHILYDTAARIQDVAGLTV